MSANIDNNPPSAPADKRNDPRAIVEACIAHANTVPEGDRIAIAVQVIRGILDNAREGGTFRYLIYDRLNFSPETYVPLYYAGGMQISDSFVLTDQVEPGIPPVVATLEELAKAEPMEPHPTLTRADGSPVPWPTRRRSDLFAALHFMRDLLESNRALVEANRRLSAQCKTLEHELGKGCKPTE